ncbi:MAG: hypothetical protein GY951_04780 [Psychromonas sp.]|nr:hypothetical protein [Alteromonadales bacterium]MCP5077355.1 hypothetical protein [Psychromonas sp.]
MSNCKNIQMNKKLVSTKVGNVPVAYWLPENKNAPVIVAFHYQTGSKDIWHKQVILKNYLLMP